VLAIECIAGIAGPEEQERCNAVEDLNGEDSELVEGEEAVLSRRRHSCAEGRRGFEEKPDLA
jgi:hypothetical protein